MWLPSGGLFFCNLGVQTAKTGSRKTGRFYDYPVRTFYGARTLPSSACRPTPAHWRTGALTHWRTGARISASTAMPGFLRLDSAFIRFLNIPTCCREGLTTTCIPGELVVVAQPRVSNRDRGTPRRALFLNISDREISQEFLMRDSVGRGFSREIFPTCMFLILTCLRESVWGALGITGEITSPVCFPPTPKRVSGTLAGSRSGGRGSLADSGLVFPPVRLVSLRTARGLGTERADIS